MTLDYPFRLPPITYHALYSYRERERILTNNKLVKSLVEIQKRKPQYVDILDKKLHGHNIYHLTSARESDLKKLTIKNKEDGATGEKDKTKEKTHQSNVHATMKSIPNSNLNQRKNEVLRIHKENMRMVKKLAEMKAHQEILVPVKLESGLFNVKNQFRSKSHQSARPKSVNSGAVSHAVISKQKSALVLQPCEEQSTGQEAKESPSKRQY